MSQDDVALVDRDDLRTLLEWVRDDPALDSADRDADLYEARGRLQDALDDPAAGHTVTLQFPSADRREHHADVVGSVTEWGGRNEVTLVHSDGSTTVREAMGLAIESTGQDVEDERAD